MATCEKTPWQIQLIHEGAFIYIGQVQKGQLHGFGQFFIKDRNLLIETTWQNGLRHGDADLYYYNPLTLLKFLISFDSKTFYDPHDNKHLLKGQFNNDKLCDLKLYNVNLNLLFNTRSTSCITELVSCSSLKK